jgi:hypothetical protein
MGIAFFFFIAVVGLAIAGIFVWGGVKELIHVARNVWHVLSE